jgi:hypothetical protein
MIAVCRSTKARFAESELNFPMSNNISALRLRPSSLDIAPNAINVPNARTLSNVAGKADNLCVLGGQRGTGGAA